VPRVAAAIVGVSLVLFASSAAQPATASAMAVSIVAPIAPLDVVSFHEDDPTWASDRLGITHPRLSFGKFGCAVTSLAMVYAYAGESISTVRGTGMDPGILNAWLGIKANNVIWTSADVPSSSWGSIVLHNYVTWTAQFPAGYSSMYNYIAAGHVHDITHELAAGRPVIAWVSAPFQLKHFVVITGFNGSDFTINDPAHRSSTLFAAGYHLLGYRVFRPTHATVTVDDTSAGFSVTGASSVLRTKTGPRTGYAAEMHYSATSGGAAAVAATWQANLPSGGVWDLYVFVPRLYTIDRDATYQISYGDRSTEIAISQLPHFDQWVLVGTGFYIPKGGPVRVTLTNSPGSGGDSLAYDAVKWVN
jgi:uncharacterized protein YvpB